MNSDAIRSLVIDTGPLSHLAKAGWLPTLRAVAGDRAVVIPDAVEAELKAGVHRHPYLQHVLEADWIYIRPLASDRELRSFAKFAARLVVGTRNIGEAAVLAYAEIHGAVAVIDDGAARKAARDFSIQLRPTLALLCDAVRDGLLTVEVVSDIADDLIASEYRLPFAPGEFVIWADTHGLLPPQE